MRGLGAARRPWVGWALAVSAMTALVFSRSLGHGFVAWDDETLIVHNLDYRGLGVAQLDWMVRSVLLGHYVPVTWLSFALDYTLWGLNPRGYHLTNVALHAANAGLLFLLAARILGIATAWPAVTRRWAALAAALVWALHPLRVEAVSWVTGRRDVLSALFFLLALGAYLEASRAAAGPRRRAWLAASVAAYALALGAKAVLMSASVVLVALDVYPLRRLPPAVRRWGDPAVRGVWIEKLPFVVLAALAAAASSVAVTRGTGYQVLSLSRWAFKVIVVVAHSVWRTFVPVSLSPLYELPRSIDGRVATAAGGAALVIAITVAVILLRRRWPAGAAGWVWHLAFLAPVAAVAHAGPQITADRYSYLPAVALSVLLGAGVGALALAAPLPPARGRGRTVGPVVVALLVGLSLLTWRQQGIWADTGRLWAHAVTVAPACMRCHVNLATWLVAREEPAAALPHLERALVLAPERILLHTNIGLALVRLGRAGEAVPHYERVLVVHPEVLPVWGSLAAALAAAGRPGEASARLAEAARVRPAEEVARYFRDLAAVQPTAPIPRLALVQAYRQLGDRARAREAYASLRALDPELARLVATEDPALVAP